MNDDDALRTLTPAEVDHIARLAMHTRDVIGERCADDPDPQLIADDPHVIGHLLESVRMLQLLLQHVYSLGSTMEPVDAIDFVLRAIANDDGTSTYERMLVATIIAADDLQKMTLSTVYPNVVRAVCVYSDEGLNGLYEHRHKLQHRQ